MANKNIYLLATYVARPKDPRQTSKPGYMKDPENIVYDEQLSITKGLKSKDMKNHVILDLTEEKIVRNSFKSDSNFQMMFAHYYNSYANYIDKSVKQLNAISDN